MKSCTRCEAELPPDRKMVWCKGCVKAHDRLRYLTTDRKSKLRLASLKAKAAARAFLRNYLSGKCCVDCKTEDYRVFQFDHTSPGTKKYNVSEMVTNGLSVKAIELEISKCDIVCANCHQIRTGKRAGFWWYTSG